MRAAAGSIADSARPILLRAFVAPHESVEGIRRVGQICIAVRDTQGTDEKNPLNFEYVRSRIEHGLHEHEGRLVIIPMPNITNIFYGRDVGYVVEQINLDAATQGISATGQRRRLLRRARLRHRPRGVLASMT